MSLWLASGIEEFASEAVRSQNAIGAEIASFFDFDIGL